MRGKSSSFDRALYRRGSQKPRAKAHLKIERYSAGLKSSFPLLKQGASTKSFLHVRPALPVQPGTPMSGNICTPSGVYLIKP